MYIANFKMADIPVVSLVGDEEEVIGKLDAAFRGVGFVFVVHHSILPQQVRLLSVDTSISTCCST